MNAIGYAHEGKRVLSPHKRSVYAFVCAHYIVPRDGDPRLGPCSGVSFEERVLSAFVHDVLEPRVAPLGEVPQLVRAIRCAVLECGSWETAAAVCASRRVGVVAEDRCAHGNGPECSACERAQATGVLCVGGASFRAV